MDTRFGQYLINRGLVMEDDIPHALDIQRKQTEAIGKIAQSEGMLTPEQVVKVLATQSDKPIFFGEAAIWLGFMTAEDLDRLLKKQARNRKPIGEILVDMGVLDKTVLKRELKNYQKKMDELMVFSGLFEQQKSWEVASSAIKQLYPALIRLRLGAIALVTGILLVVTF